MVSRLVLSFSRFFRSSTSALESFAVVSIPASSISSALSAAGSASAALRSDADALGDERAGAE